MSWFWPGFGTRGGEWEKGDTSSCSLVCLFILGGICHTPGDALIPASWISLPMSPASPDCENVLSLFQPCSRPSTLYRARKTWHRPSSASFMLHKDTSVSKDSCFGCLGPFCPAWRRTLPKFFYFATEHFLKRRKKHNNSQETIWRAGREEQSKPFLSSLWFRVQELSAHQAAHLHRGCRDELGEDERKIISPAFSLCYCADEIIQSYRRVAPSKRPTLL